MAILKNTTVNGNLIVNGDIEVPAKNGNEIYDVALSIGSLNDKVKLIRSDLDKIEFAGFSIVRSNNANSSAKIASLAKIKSIFGSGCTTNNCGAIVMNGDGNATNAHFDTVTWVGTDLYVAYNKTISGQCRITGFLWYYASTILSQDTLTL